MNECLCALIKSCQCAEIDCVSHKSGSGCLLDTDNMPINRRQCLQGMLGRVRICHSVVKVSSQKASTTNILVCC